MQLSVYSLKKIHFEGEVVSVNLKTTTGEITILDHHRPLISELASGTMKIIDTEKKEHFVPVLNGFIEIDAENHAKIVIDET